MKNILKFQILKYFKIFISNFKISCKITNMKYYLYEMLYLSIQRIKNLSMITIKKLTYTGKILWLILANASRQDKTYITWKECRFSKLIKVSTAGFLFSIKS